MIMSPHPWSISSCVYMQMAKLLRPVVLSIILCTSHARTFSLIHGYSAPLEVYKLLEHHYDAGTGNSQYLAYMYLILFPLGDEIIKEFTK